MNYRRPLQWILFLIALMLTLVLGLPAATAGTDEAASAAQPAEDVQTFTFRAPPYDIAAAGDGTSTVALEGFYPGALPGDPDLPSASMFVALPPFVPLDSVTFEISAREEEVLPGPYEIAPVGPYLSAPGPGPVLEDWGPNADAIVNGKNTAVYEKDAYFPAEPLELATVAQMRKWRFAELRYWPVSLNPVSGRLRVTSEVTVTLRYDAGGPGKQSLALIQDTMMDERAAQMFENYDEAQTWYAGMQTSGVEAATKPGYAIITTNKIAGASAEMDDFMRHKESRGFEVYLVTEDDYNSLQGQAPNQRPEKVRKWLIDNYVSKNIQYVLLIGNPDPLDQSDTADTAGDMPMKMTWPCVWCSETPTDHYFADLTGDWDIDGDGKYADSGDFVTGGVDYWAEVYVGRIPVYQSDANWTAVLDKILRKTIDYETSPDTSWRRSVLLAMAFLVTYSDGAELGEYMRADIMATSGFSTHRMYWHGSKCSSIYPSEQDLAHKAVRDHWKDHAYGIVTWFGHGGRYVTSLGYNECQPGIDALDLIHAQDASSLDDSRPALTFQTSCSTGMPEAAGNLGYSLLANGAVGTVSASRESWGYGSDPVPGDNSNESLAHYYVKNLVANSPTGEALFAVKHLSRGRKQNVLVYNLYGDPGVSLLGDSQESGSVALGDTYHAAMNRELVVPAPGVLANDVSAVGDPRLYYVAWSDNLTELAQNDDEWFGWNIGEASGAPPVAAGSELAAANVYGGPHIFYLGEAAGAQPIHEIFWFIDRWKHNNISAAIPAAPKAVPGSALSAVVINGELRLYYLAAGQDGLHIHELALEGSTWKHRDITTAAGAPPAVTGSALSSLSTHTEPRLYYVAQTAAGRHAIELAWMSYLDPANAEWSYVDITAAAGAPDVAENSPLSSHTFHTEPRVYYLTETPAGLHVHSLAWMSYLDPENAAWYHEDITKAAAAPAAAPGSALSSHTYHTEPRVYYITQTAAGRHVHGLAWMSYLDPTNARWYHQDITAAASAPVVWENSPLATMTYHTEPRAFYLEDWYHFPYPHELAWKSYLDPANADWYDTDLIYEEGYVPDPALDTDMALTTYTDDLLEATLINDVKHGTLTLYYDGSFSYEPDQGFEGVDSFSYLARSSTEAGVATVELVVSSLLLGITDTVNFLPMIAR